MNAYQIEMDIKKITGSNQMNSKDSLNDAVRSKLIMNFPRWAQSLE